MIVKEDSMSRKDIAVENFTKGYNCSQSVALAFADLTGVDENSLLKMTSSLGAGMGRLREVCGAVSAMFIVAGLLYGYDNPKATEQKAQHYAEIQKLAKMFEEQTGSIVCRELLGLDVKKEDPIPEERTEGYYKKRPCKELVGIATQILDEYISKKVNAG